MIEDGHGQKYVDFEHIVHFLVVNLNTKSNQREATNNLTSANTRKKKQKEEQSIAYTEPIFINTKIIIIQEKNSIAISVYQILSNILCVHCRYLASNCITKKKTHAFL